MLEQRQGGIFIPVVQTKGGVGLACKFEELDFAVRCCYGSVQSNINRITKDLANDASQFSCADVYLLGKRLFKKKKRAIMMYVFQTISTSVISCALQVLVFILTVVTPCRCGLISAGLNPFTLLYSPQV